MKSKVGIARMTGIALVLMGLLAGVVMSGRFGEALAGDEMTVRKLISVEGEGNIEKGAAVIWTLIMLLDFLVALGIIKIFEKSVIGKASAILRWTYTGFLITCIIILLTMRGPEAFYHFEKWWTLGLIVFGFHLITLGMSMPKSGWANMAFRWLLVIAGIGYVIVDAGVNLFPEYEHIVSEIENVFVIPMVVGELGLAVYWIIAPKRFISSL
ncbi:DUF4386 family protein [Phaeocystidibacter luteus]|uniref:DUF4386 family protein n=1 Tax=Phaeocystidibacter luteus TaxID=911197 RepID=A0A6N6RKM4_9FLAO|nr:DUF4386 family protein [Phaeocystidibacter luteus]KAB2807744.1 DUF4386 family protein [Phaeocystidibacter luteus]